MAWLRILLAVVAASIGMVLTLPLVVLAGLVGGVRGLTCVIAGWLEPRFMPWEELLEFDAALGWKPKPNVDAHYLTREQPEIYSVRTGPDGWPGTRSLADSDVVVIGDSYAFGYGVDAGATFGEQARPLRVKAVGSPAYGMVQQLLVMRQLASQLRGKHVIWLIFLGNDLLENLLPGHVEYRRPFVREANGHGWEIVTRHIRRERWPFLLEPYRDGRAWMTMKLDLYRVLETRFSRRAYAACEFLVGEGQRLCRVVGAELTVMTVPDPPHVVRQELAYGATLGLDDRVLVLDVPDRRIGGICQALGVRFVAARQFLDERHYRAIDPHWNEAGHRRIAEAIRHIVGQTSDRTTSTTGVGA